MKQVWKTRITGIVRHKATGLFLLMHNSNKGLDYWEFPAGTMEFGETPEQTAKREVLEESGLDARSIGLFDVSSCFYSHKDTDVHELVIAYLFETDEAVVDITKNIEAEHDEWKWVSLEELNAVQNLAATVKCLLGTINSGSNKRF
jgi:8-oxo-dGTP pyrophosphatase MutT (NUDIX family)